MTKKILSGNEAVALGAFESGVKVASAYPGTPSTEILQNLATYEGVYAEWAPNEKVSLEVTAGASMAGVRAFCAMKHVGMNVAADPLMTLTYTGVYGGLVIACADDPGMHSSQNEQDNRYYARFAQIPMLEPCSSQEARDMVPEAYRISEEYDTPVMLRLTTRISHSKGIVTIDSPDPVKTETKGFKRDLKKFVAVPSHARLRHPLVLERLEKLKTLSNKSPLNVIEWQDTGIGVITSGISYQYVKEVLPKASILKLGLTFPLPDRKIKEFSSKVDRLFVVEELEPYLEDDIKIMGIQAEGKKYFPRIYELSPNIVAGGFVEAGVLAEAKHRHIEPPEGANMPRPPLMCAGCSHRGLFYALNKLKGIVHGDIGCYALSALPPLQATESCLCMGASISMAHGTAKAMESAKIEDKRPVFAAIGDSTFFHSGITSLLDVIYNNSNVNVIVLDNRTTAMTGGQQNPGTGRTLQNEETVKVDILKLARALGAKRTRKINPFNISETVAILKEEASFKGPSVMMTTRPCVQLLKQDPSKIRRVEPDACIGCGLCLTLGCPAISQGEKIKPQKGKKERYRAVIDPSVCMGCTLCRQVCKQDAIISA